MPNKTASRQPTQERDMTIILPAGVAEDWRDAHNEANPDQWDELASNLLRHAAAAISDEQRDDLATLALVAAHHASHALDAWCLDQLEAA
jgi:hypothetical protein